MSTIDKNQMNADLNSILEAYFQDTDNLMVGDQPPEERLKSKSDENGK